MKFILFVLALILCHSSVFSQEKKLTELGYRYFNFKYDNDPVDVLIKSKKGDYQEKKPVLLFIQGSLDRPLIINYPENNNYKYDIAFPFKADSLTENYHIAVISKPFIPVIADSKNINKQFMFVNDTVSNSIPMKFLKRNNLYYYVNRNLKVLNKLKKLSFVGDIILAGHSEGSRIAFEMTQKAEQNFPLIFLSGNPFGRYINTVISRRRHYKDQQFLKSDSSFKFLNNIIKNKKTENFEDGGNTYKSWYDYNKPFFKSFLKIKSPVFYGYGTQSKDGPYNDLFRNLYLMEESENKTILFKSYKGLEHSFYQVKDNGEVDHSKSYFNKVIQDALNWYENLY